MPFDNAPSARPYMREGTAALAALVATRPARDVLTLVHAELLHRERPAARRLRDEVAAILSASVSSPVPADGEQGKARRVLDTPPAPDHLWPEPKPLVLDPVANAWGAEPVAFEVIPCAHGEVLPEYRETVIAGPQPNGDVVQPDGTLTPAAAFAPQPSGNGPSKPAKRAKADKRPGDVGWRPPSLEVLIKRVGNAELRWSPDVCGAFGNPLHAARVEALKAEGWQHLDSPDGYMVFQRDGARLRIGHHGMIYLGDATWVQLAKDERDRLTDAGRAILERAAAGTARKAKRAGMRRGLKPIRKTALDYCAKWRAMQGTDKAKWYPVEGRKSALITAWAKRKELLAKIAAA